MIDIGPRDMAEFSFLFIQKRLYHIVDKLPPPSLCSAYPHLINPQEMVATSLIQMPQAMPNLVLSTAWNIMTSKKKAVKSRLFGFASPLMYRTRLTLLGKL